MNLFAEHKGFLKIYAVVFLLFGLVLLVCGTMFEDKNSVLGEHQETAYRQDQVHYWTGVPFIVHGIVSILFIVLEVQCMLKFCICMDYICMNIAIFVIIVEGPDWKKYQAKTFHYDDAGDLDYEMIKPVYDFGSTNPLTKSSYSKAMYSSGIWVFIAICSILVCVDAFLVHIKVYCGIKSIFGYLSGYEIVNPEISLKTAQPVGKIECKGCQTKLTTPVSPQITRIKESRPPEVPTSPVIELLPQSVRDGGVSVRDGGVSPAFSDASNVSDAFYVCQEGDEIKLVGYKPRRRDPHVPQLCTHHEEEEGNPDHYHFAKKPPSLYENPSDPPRSHSPHVLPSFPKRPPLTLMIPDRDASPGHNSSRGTSPATSGLNSPHRSAIQSPLVSLFTPIAPAPPPLPLQMQPGGSRSPAMDRSPGSFSFVGGIFPIAQPAMPEGVRPGRRVSFADPAGSHSGSPVNTPSSPQRLDTLI